MKKLICLLGHNKHLMKLKDCNKEEFENENRKITVFTCKYCDKDVLVYTNYLNGHINPKNIFNHEIKNYNNSICNWNHKEHIHRDGLYF